MKSGIYSEKKNHIEKPIDQPISDTCGRVQNRHSRGLERKKRKRSRRFIRGRQATPNCWLSPVVLHPPPLPETLSSRSRHLAPPSVPFRFSLQRVRIARFQPFSPFDSLWIFRVLFVFCPMNFWIRSGWRDFPLLFFDFRRNLGTNQCLDVLAAHVII